MFHAIEFQWLVVAEVSSPDHLRPKQVLMKEGTRLFAEIKPYVAESSEGPLEVADLYLEDGSIARAVRYAAFRFLDKSKRRAE